MNPYPYLPVNSPICASFGYMPLVKTALFVCLLASAATVEAQQSGWSLTGSLGTPRSGHTATLLANGKVLVVGGGNSTGTSEDSAEVYDPATAQWSATANLSSPHGAHVAVRLINGKVLVVGRGTAEIFNPETSSWSPAGEVRGGSDGTGTLLADGRVLIVGGSSNSTIAELYNPATGAWSSAGTLNAPRSLHTATLLPNGKVLVVGGSGAPRSAELYDPTTGTWMLTGDLITPRLWDHHAALLPSGKVLVVGGGISGDDYCNGVDSAELYDPETGQWSPTGSAISTRNDYYDYNSATLLPNGKVLMAGGAGPGCYALNSSELYDPASGRWSVGASLNTARLGHTVTLLANGKVLVAGGGDFNGATRLESDNSAELFDSGTATVTSISGASLAASGALAPESIAIAVGANLAIGTQIALPSLPLPTQLAGVKVRVRDRVGVERLAPLSYVSSEQINYQVPSGTVVGLATVTVTSGESVVAAGVVEIAGVAPGLSTANSTGGGVAAGYWIRVAEGGAQSQDYLFDLITRKSIPVVLGPPSDRVFLSLYGTGFRGGANAIATVGGISVPVNAFAAVKDYQGLDVVNIGPLPRSLEGRGEMDVAFFADGKAANLVRVNIR